MVSPVVPAPEFIGLNTGEPPFVVLPRPDVLFGRRAARFRALTLAHQLEPYLNFLAILADAQQKLVGTSAAPVLVQADVDRAYEHTMPPLSTQIAAVTDIPAMLALLIADLSETPLDPGPKAALDRLAAMDSEERGALLASVAEGAFPLEQLAEAAVVSAALQVWFARAAAQLDPAVVKTVEEGICPACGSAPVASMIVGWPQAPNSRYLCCSLCNIYWNYVRVKCTACTTTQGISYRMIEGQPDDMAAEVCEGCGGYAKHLMQHKTPSIDPFADDVASYGLDVLLREEGWKRTTINPFLVG
ncbi:formate dehydrogenase accessory protein FdhE [Beijerinckia sp. L45]|uniref:formate dehydrogenase accessory protein FdhE n=1 Tax=Beijerinckia sp. L45 TaxID=1641855 RepID=UPI00131EB171|nr:formate dehydrogenase accessory protein FdhE [Beijerinckia sp. L45]